MTRKVFFIILLCAYMLLGATVLLAQSNEATMTVASNAFSRVENTAGGFGGLSYASMVVADFNADSAKDIILCGLSDDGSLSGKAYAALFTNNKAGRFAEYSPLELRGAYYAALELSDIDSDGDDDIIINGYDGSSAQSSVYLNNSPSNGIDFELYSNSPFRAGYYGSVCAADFDADGDIDYIVNGFDGKDKFCEVYENEGALSFDKRAASNLPAIDNGGYIAADFDGDGDIDLIGSGLTDGSIEAGVFINEGDFTFTKKENPIEAVKNAEICAADFDGDGSVDVIISGHNGVNPISRLYLNGGSADFTPHKTLKGIYRGSLATADLDDDSDIDIYSSGYSKGLMNVLYVNDGFASLSMLDNIGVHAAGDGDALIEDFDGDTYPDILQTGVFHSGTAMELYVNGIREKGKVNVVPASAINTNEDPRETASAYTNKGEETNTLDSDVADKTNERPGNTAVAMTDTGDTEKDDEEGDDATEKDETVEGEEVEPAPAFVEANAPRFKLKYNFKDVSLEKNPTFDIVWLNDPENVEYYLVYEGHKFPPHPQSALWTKERPQEYKFENLNKSGTNVLYAWFKDKNGSVFKSPSKHSLVLDIHPAMTVTVSEDDGAEEDGKDTNEYEIRKDGLTYDGSEISAASTVKEIVRGADGTEEEKDSVSELVKEMSSKEEEEPDEIAEEVGPVGGPVETADTDAQPKVEFSFYLDLEEIEQKMYKLSFSGLPENAVYSSVTVDDAAHPTGSSGWEKSIPEYFIDENVGRDKTVYFHFKDAQGRLLDMECSYNLSYEDGQEAPIVSGEDKESDEEIVYLRKNGLGFDRSQIRQASGLREFVIMPDGTTNEADSLYDITGVGIKHDIKTDDKKPGKTDKGKGEEPKTEKKPKPEPDDEEKNSSSIEVLTKDEAIKKEGDDSGDDGSLNKDSVAKEDKVSVKGAIELSGFTAMHELSKSTFTVNWMDDLGAAQYLVVENSDDTPKPEAKGWTELRPDYYTFDKPKEGTNELYVWFKNADGRLWEEPAVGTVTLSIAAEPKSEPKEREPKKGDGGKPKEGSPKKTEKPVKPDKGAKKQTEKMPAPRDIKVPDFTLTEISGTTYAVSWQGGDTKYIEYYLLSELDTTKPRAASPRWKKGQPKRFKLMDEVPGTRIIYAWFKLKDGTVLKRSSKDSVWFD